MWVSRLILLGFFLSACAPLGRVGQPPGFSPTLGNAEHTAMMSPDDSLYASPHAGDGSLWSGGRSSLLGDRRAERQGDILTVVIEIDDSAQISNSSARSRNAQQSMSVPSLFGFPQRAAPLLPEGATFDSAVDLGSSATASGNGTVSRREKLTLRIAATIVDILPNGILAISGSQQVRVNFEMRELTVTGLVRPEDISRQNEITYDKIASARISYGGEGQISDMQQPRYGQQILDAILPF